MCRIDDAEPINTFKDMERRRARSGTKHCDECRRPINAGEIYYYTCGKLDGDFVSFLTCWHCRVGVCWLQLNCGGWVYSEVADELSEHAVDYAQQPRLPMQLARMLVGVRRKWRRFDGTGLMRAPTLPEYLR